MEDTPAKTKPEGPMAANRTPLAELDDPDRGKESAEWERRMLEVALTVLRRNNETETPSEYLIERVLHSYGLAGRLDPQEVDEIVARFKEDLDYLVQQAAQITKQYPELVADAA